MRLIHSILFLSAALCLHGQGNVNFANIGVGLNSPFTDFNVPDPRLNGGTWTVELWAGPNTSGVGAVLAGPAYMGAFTNGYFNAGQRTVSNVTGSFAYALVRVWDNMGGTITSYAQATTTANVRFAQSPTFTISLTTPPATPATMVNMPALLIGPPIPEPSTILLGLLGAVGALLFRRR